MNKQNPVAADYDESGAIDVHSIFKTIQGEGPFCGQRALFIRLYGCNLRCPGCDTDYTSARVKMTPQALLDTVIDEQNWPYGSLIVITGGEPFRQNVVPIIHLLLMAGYRVQVETTGVLCPPDFDIVRYSTGFSVVVSPKTSRISSEISATASAFKYVLQAGEIEDDGLPTRALGHAASPRVARPPNHNVPIYVQPMDEQDAALNAANTNAAVRECMAHDYTLQLQTHKILGLE